MYLPYIEALKPEARHHQEPGRCRHSVDTLEHGQDKVPNLPAKSRKMGIPYIVCPLGDISERNCHNPHLKRSLQTLMYQKSNVQAR